MTISNKPQYGEPIVEQRNNALSVKESVPGTRFTVRRTSKTSLHARFWKGHCLTWPSQWSTRARLNSDVAPAGF